MALGGVFAPCSIRKDMTRSKLREMAVARGRGALVPPGGSSGAWRMWTGTRLAVP